MKSPDLNPHSQKSLSLVKVIVPIIVISLAVVGGLTLLKNSQPSKSPLHVSSTGSVSPDFDLKSFPSEKVKKFSTLGNKLTLLNFWATWCEACMIEIPSILKLRNQFKDQGFEVVFINVDQNPAAVLPKTLKELKIDFGVYTDTDGVLSDLFDVHAIPLTAILDKNRKILLLESGERDWNDKEIQTQISNWLKNDTK